MHAGDGAVFYGRLIRSCQKHSQLWTRGVSSIKQTLCGTKGSAPGIGWYVKSKHELLLIGAGTQTAHPITKPNSYFDAKRGIHSRKPSIVYEIIESMYNGPYVELFARTKRDDWDSWGNEL